MQTSCPSDRKKSAMKFLVVTMFVFTLGSATQDNKTGKKTNPSPQWIYSPTVTCQVSGARENMSELMKKVEYTGKRVQENGKKVEDNGKNVQELLKKVLDNGKKIDALEKKLSTHRNNSLSCQANGTKEMTSELMKKVEDNGKNVQENGKKIDALEKKLFPPRLVGKDCSELYKQGYKQDGVYTINPDGLGEFQVFCDQTRAGGGWTIFQRRLDGSVDFYRGWTDYEIGFGDVRGEYWLGLKKINRLTRLGSNKLRVDLQDTSSNWAYAEYENLCVLGKQTKYKLSIGKYTGTASDSLSYHKNQPFSTKDRDNDSWSRGNCAQRHKGAWWYNDCHQSNLNGLYLYGSSSSSSVVWYFWKGYNSLKRTEMKIRPMSY